MSAQNDPYFWETASSEFLPLLPPPHPLVPIFKLECEEKATSQVVKVLNSGSKRFNDVILSFV
jgi:hypothetical protein